jgi:hypothetical protein
MVMRDSLPLHYTIDKHAFSMIEDRPWER